MAKTTLRELQEKLEVWEIERLLVKFSGKKWTVTDRSSGEVGEGASLEEAVENLFEYLADNEDGPEDDTDDDDEDEDASE